MNYLDCPRLHLKACGIGLAITVTGTFALSLAFPLPDTPLGLALGLTLGLAFGFYGVHASFMIGHRLTCGKDDQRPPNPRT